MTISPDPSRFRCRPPSRRSSVLVTCSSTSVQTSDSSPWWHPDQSARKDWSTLFEAHDRIAVRQGRIFGGITSTDGHERCGQRRGRDRCAAHSRDIRADLRSSRRRVSMPNEPCSSIRSPSIHWLRPDGCRRPMWSRLTSKVPNRRCCEECRRHFAASTTLDRRARCCGRRAVGSVVRRSAEPTGGVRVSVRTPDGQLHRDLVEGSSFHRHSRLCLLVGARPSR